MSAASSKERSRSCRDLGSIVRQGQVLARLSSREFQLRVDQAEAALQQARSRLGLRGDSERLAPEQNSEVRQAKAALDEARLRYDRATTLIKNGDIPQERYDQAEIGFQSAEARYQAAQDTFYNQLAVIEQRVAELQLARKELNDATIRSPLDGSVSVRHVTREEYLRPRRLSLPSLSPILCACKRWFPKWRSLYPAEHSRDPFDRRLSRANLQGDHQPRQSCAGREGEHSLSKPQLTMLAAL